MTNFERTGGQTTHSDLYSDQNQGVQTLWGSRPEMLVENSSADVLYDNIKIIDNQFLELSC
jgi:hypothetical protein